MIKARQSLLISAVFVVASGTMFGSRSHPENVMPRSHIAISKGFSMLTSRAHGAPQGQEADVPESRADDRSASSLTGEHLELRYGKTTVVDDVSVTLEPGHVTALVGPNGSGKSTLLRSLARLHPVNQGHVSLRDGTGSKRMVALLNARQFAREVTLFSQARPAPQGLTVAEVTALGRHPYRRSFAGLSPTDKAVIEHAMTVTGVRDMADRAVGELSGGEMQRVWLAACLAQDTSVVLLDEPTNHLDLRYQIETLDLVRDLADDHGVAIGIVLHDLDHAARVADTLLLIDNGRIHAAGSPHAVLTAGNISEVYRIPVDVSVEPHTGRLRIDPRGRHFPRNRDEASASDHSRIRKDIA